VVSCLIEEGPDEVEALVVGYVRSRFLASWLAVRVLHSNINHSAIRKKTDAYVRDICFDDNRSDSRCDGNGVEGHDSNPSSIGSFAANDIELFRGISEKAMQ
jgi:hypothetical protein